MIPESSELCIEYKYRADLHLSHRLASVVLIASNCDILERQRRADGPKPVAGPRKAVQWVSMAFPILDLDLTCSYERADYVEDIVIQVVRRNSTFHFECCTRGKGSDAPKNKYVNERQGESSLRIQKGFTLDYSRCAAGCTFRISEAAVQGCVTCTRV